VKHEVSEGVFREAVDAGCGLATAARFETTAKGVRGNGSFSRYAHADDIAAVALRRDP
jgi:hypothetical protein